MVARCFAMMRGCSRTGWHTFGLGSKFFDDQADLQLSISLEGEASCGASSGASSGSQDQLSNCTYIGNAIICNQEKGYIQIM